MKMSLLLLIASLFSGQAAADELWDRQLPNGVFEVRDVLKLPPTQHLWGHGRGTILKTYAADGVLAERHLPHNAGSIRDLTIEVQTEGANGIRIWECDSFEIRNVLVKFRNNSRLGGKGIVLDGGAKGGHYNRLDHVTIFCFATGISVETTNNRIASSNAHTFTAFRIWNCGTGLDVVAGSTSQFQGSAEKCTVPARFGKNSARNNLTLRVENCEFNVLVNEWSRENKIDASTWASPFKDDPN